MFFFYNVEWLKEGFLAFTISTPLDAAPSVYLRKTTRDTFQEGDGAHYGQRHARATVVITICTGTLSKHLSQSSVEA